MTNAMPPVAPTIPGIGAPIPSTNVPPRPPINEKYSAVDIFFALFKQQPETIVKGLGYGTYWLGKVCTVPSGISNFSLETVHFKNFLSAIKIPERSRELWKSFNGLWADWSNRASVATEETRKKIVKSTFKIIQKASNLTSSVCDAVDFSTKYVPSMDKGFLHGVKTASYTATFVGSGVSAGEQIVNITTQQDPEGKKAAFYLLNLARDVSYVALGAIGLYGIITVTPIAPAIILACLTSGLSFGIGSFFYEKIKDPENKGTNLIPDAVVENVVQRRRRTISA